MLRKLFSSILMTVILIQAGGYVVFAQDKSAQRIEQLKEKIAKLGTGEKARVAVTLANGSKVNGYVSQINANSFVVTDKKSSTTTEIQFSDVNKLAGRNMSTGTKVALGFGIAAVALALLALIALHYSD